MTVKKFSFLDQVFISLDNGIRALFAQPMAKRTNPALDEEEPILLPTEREKSAALMRINHAGEICAQALYLGQAWVAKSSTTQKMLLASADEETDHLAWCQQRLQELDSHTSYLNPLWYLGSFTIGLLVGILEDKWSLGFVVETERQVGKHLQGHLEKLPLNDNKSKAILQQMCEDEAHHAFVAQGAGASELPDLVKIIMGMMAKCMTKTTYYL